MNRLRKLGDNLKECRDIVRNKTGITGNYSDKTAIIEGWLTKRATKSAKRWNLRYFVLYEDALVYYADSDSEFPRGEIILGDSFFVSDSSLMKYAFQASDLDNTYYLSADTMDEKLFWLHNIAQVIRRMDHSAPALASEDFHVYEELEQRVSEYATLRASTNRSSMMDKPDKESFLLPPVGVMVSSTGKRSPVPAPRPDEFGRSTRDTMTPIPKLSDLISSLQQSAVSSSSDKRGPIDASGSHSSSNIHKSKTVGTAKSCVHVGADRPSIAKTTSKPMDDKKDAVVALASGDGLAEQNNSSSNTDDSSGVAGLHVEPVQQLRRLVQQSATTETGESVRSGFKAYWELTDTEQRLSNGGTGPTAPLNETRRSPPPALERTASPPLRLTKQSSGKTVIFKPPLRATTPPALRSASAKRASPEESPAVFAAVTPPTPERNYQPENRVLTPPSSPPVSSLYSPPSAPVDKSPVHTPKQSPSRSPTSSRSPSPEGGVSAAAKMWQQRVQSHQQGQTGNPFSGKSSLSRTAALRPGDEGYGRAPEGSLTATRAASAAEWVERELDRLCEVIRRIGTDAGEAGEVRVCFGELFYAYQVGIITSLHEQQLAYVC